MKLGYAIGTKQQQKMVMSPERIQALNILQAGGAELGDYIKEELLTNPALEIAEPARELKPIKADDVKDHIAERQAAFEESMYDFLKSQLRLSFECEHKISIGEFIIDSIDPWGYLTMTECEMAKAMNEDRQSVAEVLSVIRQFDPPGIAATDLKDCVRRQLKQKGRLDRMTDKLVEYHLEDLAENRIEKISRDMGISIEAVKQSAELIKSINPKPGSIFAGDSERAYIFPDVIVKKDDEGNLVVENDRTVIPSLCLSSYYEKLIRDESQDGVVMEYLSERIEAAIRLIRAIERREKTMMNITWEIIRFQEEFFKKGEKYLKPMTMGQIAESIGMAESTVSRAIRDKYIQCPCGVYKMRYFFSAGVENGSGEGVSAVSIKKYIAEMIEKEDGSKPLSDQKLALELGKMGMDISRRTVAKYREEMGIGSSSKRRKY